MAMKILDNPQDLTLTREQHDRFYAEYVQCGHPKDDANLFEAFCRHKLENQRLLQG